MTVHSRSAGILGVALICVFSVGGCRQIRPTQTTRQICNCENCRRARGEIRYQGGVPQPPGDTANPSGGVKRETRAPLPSDRRASRVPFPQSPNVIEYREPTMFERVKFRLQRMNPFAKAESPVMRYGPSPGYSRVLPNLAEPQTTSMISDESDGNYTPARISNDGTKQVNGSGSSLQVEQWPFRSEESHLATATNRDEHALSSGAEAADQNRSRLTIPGTSPQVMRSATRSRVVESPVNEEPLNGDGPAFVPHASPYENYRRTRDVAVPVRNFR